jgi:hypothetical protein
MALAPDLTDPNNPVAVYGDPRVDAHLRNPVVAVLHWDTPWLGGLKHNVLAAVMGHQPAMKERIERAYNEFIEHLRHYLARGIPVIVRGWSYQHKVLWSHNSVQNFKGSLDQLIDYQGK